ncbi:MAG: penicillin-binding transpeptidase domain-containing protein [Pseudomonadota bacterium]
MRGLLIVLACLVPAVLPRAARAAEDCFIVTELKTARVVAKQGLCAARHSPVATFDIPLALIGFDSGVLRSEREPVLDPPRGEPSDAAPLTPRGWATAEASWFGTAIATKIGAERLAAYLRAFAYGNENLSGDPGAPDGFARAWQSSSLAISPREQVDFLRKMLNGDLAVSPEAVGRTLTLFRQPEMPAGYELFGTSGTGYQRLAEASLDRTRPLGWFVGWVEKDGRTLVFVRFMSLDVAIDEPLGQRARRQSLGALAAVLGAQGR